MNPLAQHTALSAFAAHALAAIMMLSTSVLTLAACDNTDAVLKKRLQAVEAAIIYQDLDGLFALHVASLGQDPICTPPADRLHRRAAARAKGEACAEAAAVINSPQAREKLNEDALMLVEMLDHHCRHPGASCQDFSKARFKRLATQSRLWTRRVETMAVQRIVREGQEATAYVDILYDGHPQPDRVALRMRHIDDSGWMLTSHPW